MPKEMSKIGMKKRRIFLWALILLIIIGVLLVFYSKYRISFDYSITTGPLHPEHVLLPAIARGDSTEDLRSLILEHPTSLSEIQLGGITPLYMASTDDNWIVFEFLLLEHYRGDRIIEHCTDPGRYSVLHDAIYKNEEGIIELILENMDVRGEDILACDYPFSKLLDKSIISDDLKDRLKLYVEE